jgi:hypothetical protein
MTIPLPVCPNPARDGACSGPLYHDRVGHPIGTGYACLHCFQILKIPIGKPLVWPPAGPIPSYKGKP